MAICLDPSLYGEGCIPIPLVVPYLPLRLHSAWSCIVGRGLVFSIMPSRPDAILIGPEIPEKSVDIIADYHDLCGECPVWDPDAGVLYWTDSVALRFYRYDPRTGKHEIVKSGLEINGFRLNRSGG